MKWNHLPRTGLLDDQDPDLIDRWMIIFSERAKAQKEEMDAKKREMDRNRAGGGIKRPSKRRR